MAGGTFPRQTHFIGVLIPDELTDVLEECRGYMHENFGCKSGHGTPVHVTLVPPFKLTEPHATNDLADAIRTGLRAGEGLLGFPAKIRNFDGFGERTLYAKVEAGDKWTTLRDAVLSAVLKAVPGSVKKPQRAFQPHLTVANRDIPPGAFALALEALNARRLFASFPVDNVTLFEFDGRKWRPAVSLRMDG